MKNLIKFELRKIYRVKGVQPLYFSDKEKMRTGSRQELQSAEVRGFQTAHVSAGKRESNPRSIQIFWDNLTSSKMEVSYG